ncbi:MAG TPA: phytanoyl-CoA dioxygenase family protein [Acidimicrobiales bacterium]|nr:phytanoyl-CoA dioxygenase family protein [Acidimicrobiales bacterium]
MSSGESGRATLVRDYALTGEQIRSFDEQGFLVLPHRVPGPTLARLQEAADQWIATGKRSRGTGPTGDDYRFADRGGRDVMYRVDYLHDKEQPASLELLGSPEVLGIAESLAGRNFVPTYEAMVFKDTGNGAPIEWHQDATHPRRYRIFNVDIYLDAALPGQGALRVVPGSQVSKLDMCELKDQHGWGVPGSLEVEMGPGDVLVHDVMLVHGSEPTLGNALRRTIYYEFRPAEQILAEGPWDRSWVDKRLRMLPLAFEAYAKVNPGQPGFVWQIGPDFRPAATSETELRVPHLVHSPGSYCSAGDVPAKV